MQHVCALLSHLGKRYHQVLISVWKSIQNASFVILSFCKAFIYSMIELLIDSYSLIVWPFTFPSFPFQITNDKTQPPAKHNNNCTNAVSSCRKKILYLLLHISFTSLLIRKCNLYFHKPAGYFVSDLCDPPLIKDLCSSHQHPFKMWDLFVRKNAHLNDDARREGFRCSARWGENADVS